MNIRKTSLGQSSRVYAVAALRIKGAPHFLSATELYGEWNHFGPPDYRPNIASHHPGGVMGLVSLPGETGALLALEQCYPTYNFLNSRISLALPAKDPGGLWLKKPLAAIPYLHRVGVFPGKDALWVIASTLCGAKQTKDDWAVPGAVYAARFDANNEDTPLIFTPILQNISRNHGMHIAPFRGRQTLFISGMEGLFALCPQRDDDHTRWDCKRLLAHDVSDACCFDFDGDGAEEIAAIEPFHGNRVVMYHVTPEGLLPFAQESVDYGHVLWGGFIRGRRCLLIGSRRGAKDLRLLVFRGDGTVAYDTLTLDQGAGPANVSVVSQDDRDFILCANHTCGETALYEITD